MSGTSEPRSESERLMAWALYDMRVLLSHHVRNGEAHPTFARPPSLLTLCTTWRCRR